MGVKASDLLWAYIHTHIGTVQCNAAQATASWPVLGHGRDYRKQAALDIHYHVDYIPTCISRRATRASSHRGPNGGSSRAVRAAQVVVVVLLLLLLLLLH